MDTNINNYSILELLTILGLDYNDIRNKKKINTECDKIINRFKGEQSYELETFFREMKSILINYSDQLNYEDNKDTVELNNIKKQTDEWYKEEVLKQKDENQNSKNTDRQQKIQVYNNEHNPMKREKLGIANNYIVGVSQDTLNPNLQNYTTRFINLDSQFRQVSVIEESSTNYTLDLSDPLTNVLSLRLFSFEIPYTWYNIDNSYGNNTMWITDPNTNTSVSISLSSGNYSVTNFADYLFNAFKNSTLAINPNNIIIDTSTTGFRFNSGITSSNVITYNEITNKITLNLISSGTKFYLNNEFIFTVDESSIITFFDYTNKLNNLNNLLYSSCKKQNYINQSLGWLMGFRLPYVNASINGNTAPSVVDFIGTKYLILALDDYNQNHINNGLVSITELSKTMKMPSYFSYDLTYTCSKPSSNLQSNINNINQQINENENNSLRYDSGDLLMDKLNNVYKKIPTIQNNQKNLTQSQIYTINEIIKNNERNTNFRASAPTTLDVFALIPVKALAKGQLYTEMTGSLQNFKRTYFGPVDIDRMKIKLLDDKGNILNLNGSEWSVTLLCETLYQY